MSGAPKPTYPTVVIPPGAGGGSGGGDGMSEAAVKALIALRRSARTVSGNFTVGANDGIITVNTSDEVTGTLTAIASLGVGKAFLVNNGGTEVVHLTPADEANVFNYQGAPGSPPGYEVAPGAAVLLVASASAAWSVLYDSSLLGTGGGGGGATLTAVDYIASAVGEGYFDIVSDQGTTLRVTWDGASSGMTVLATPGGALFTTDGNGGASSIDAPAGTYVATNTDFGPGFLSVAAIAPGGGLNAALVAPSPTVGVVAHVNIFAASQLPTFEDSLDAANTFAAYIPPASGPGTGVTAIMIYDPYENGAQVPFYRGAVTMERTSAVYTGDPDHEPYWTVLDDAILAERNSGGIIHADLDPGDPTSVPVTLRVMHDMLSGGGLVVTTETLNGRQIGVVTALVEGTGNPIGDAIRDLIAAAEQDTRILPVQVEWVVDYQGQDLPIDGSKNPFPPVESTTYPPQEGRPDTATDRSRTVLVYNVVHDGEDRNGFWSWNGDDQPMTRPDPDHVIGAHAITGVNINYGSIAGRGVVVVGTGGTSPGQSFPLSVPTNPTDHHLYRVIDDGHGVGSTVFMLDSGVIPTHASLVSLYSHQGPHEVSFQPGHRRSTTIKVEGYSNRYEVKDASGRVLRVLTDTGRPVTFHPTMLGDGTGGHTWFVSDPNDDPDDVLTVCGYQGNTALVSKLSSIAPDPTEFTGYDKMGYHNGVTLVMPGSDHSDQLCLAAWDFDLGYWNDPASGINPWTGKQIVGVEVDIGSIIGGDLTVLVSAEWLNDGAGQWQIIDGASIDTATWTPVPYSGSDLPLDGDKALAEVTQNTRVVLTFDEPRDAAGMDHHRLVLAAYEAPGGTVGSDASVQVLRLKPILVSYADIRAAQIVAG